MARKIDKNRKGNKKVFILLVISTILVIFSLYLLFNSLAKPIEVKEFDVKFLVGENPGFDLNGTALTFGRITRGGSGMRSIVLENNHDFPIKAMIIISNEVREYVNVEKLIYLNEQEKKTVQVTILIPNDMEFGEYTGKIRILSYRA